MSQLRRKLRRRHHRWPFRLALWVPPIVLEQPWAIFVMSLCIVSGATTFLGPEPGSISALLPPIVVKLWSVTLIAGASSGLCGLLRPRVWRLEIAGLIWLGTASVVYAVTIFMRFGLPGLVAGSIVLAFGLAALTRALAVYVSFEIVRSAARE